MPSINKIIMYSFTGVLGIFVIDEYFEFFVTQKDFCPLYNRSLVKMTGSYNSGDVVIHIIIDSQVGTVPTALSFSSPIQLP